MSESLRELPIPAVETFLDMCRYRAAAQADLIAYTFLTDGELDEHNLTYGQLDALARRIAVRLAGAEGGRALLLYPPGLDYVAAFFGCIYAGVTPVPLYPPDPLRMDRTLPRLQAVCSDAEAVAVLGTATSLSWVKTLMTIGPSVRMVVATDALAAAEEHMWVAPQISGDTLALLQYTSGSTGTPRGVMVNHRNMLYNVSKMDRGRSHAGVVGVTWLPAYHDFGLIGAVLLPMYAGRRVVSMSPLDFMQRPVRWLEAISRYRGTYTGAPNFSFDLCTRTVKPEELDSLDLRSLDVVLNGAEPVRRDTLDRFAKTFARCGFRPEVFVPCYGLAEATLGVTGGDNTRPYTVGHFCAEELQHNRAVKVDPQQEDARIVAGCGQAIEGTEVLIVDPHTSVRCAENHVGEIWVRGPGVAQGYWNRREETQHTFGAQLTDTGEGPFLRTGDLGFFHDGELFVTGRLKDLIILCGRNYYPQDIERTVAGCHAALKIDAGAAFSVERDGEEKLVVVQEVTRPQRLDLEAIVQSVRRAVLAEHDLAVDTVVLIKSATIGKTTSGKIRRRSCREDYLEGRLTIVAQWRAAPGGGAAAVAGREIVAPRNNTEQQLLLLWSEVLRQDDLSIHDNFFDFGGHSLLATQLVSRVTASLGVTLPLGELFAAPTVSELAPVVDRLRAEQAADARPAIRHCERTGEAPLSFGQQRLWFVSQWLPDVPVNNLCVAAHFHGALDHDILKSSLAEIARRHESLRTTFVTVEGVPWQKIDPLPIVPLVSHDVSDRAADERMAELQRIEQSVAQQTYDLSSGPLWNVTHVRLSSDEQVLLLGMHHIISDGWSMGILLRELLLVYEAFSTGQRSPLAELEIQYADFAAWQRDAYSSEALRPQLDYWQQKLADGPAVLAVPTDRPRGAVQTFRGAYLPVSLPATLSQTLEEFSRGERATLFMTLLASFQTLLSRYSSQTDISVGTAVAHRTRPELEGLIGFFVNTLVMRGDLSGDPTFRELLARTRATCLEAYEHQDIPFERLVEQFAPRRALSHSPLYQAALILQNAPFDFTGSGFAFREVHNGTARHDMTLSLWSENGRLTGGLEYNADLFDQSTMEHLLRAFEALLTAAVTSPDRPISQIPLVALHDRERMLAAGAGEEIPFADNVGIHELFERQVALCPDAIAVSFEGHELTYRELDERANRLSRRLRSLGVGPEQLVGLSLDRSCELIVGMLGILKAGGAYVPLDPRYPRARLDLIVQDAGIAWVVTSKDSTLPLLGDTVQLVDVNEDVEVAGDEIATAGRAGPHNLAYVIYTSGSTGKPKGAQIEHRSVCNMVDVAARWFAPGVRPRTLQFASPNFDASVIEIFTTLAVGGTLFLLPETALNPGPDFVQTLDDLRITFVILPPSALAVLPQARLPHLATLVVAGEACPAQLVEQWAPGRRMINGYGPTETTVGATSGECLAGERRKPPIGRPFANVEVYLLDNHLEPVPPGMPGEIFIGGVGVGRGYLNRPELTAERFLPDRFGRRSGGKIYRTGDLARYRADGQLEYLGRIDQQVKIRGFRIELAEIEAALSEHTVVRDAAVVVREHEMGEKRLVAYLAIGEDAAPTTSELYQFLKERLPSHMIPAAFVTLAKLPLSPTGKVDRAALPAVEGSRPALRQNYVAPRTDNEVALAHIWSQVLNIERVGIHDNFFEIGGDSLLSIQVIARAARAGLRLTPRQLFEQQTIAEQALVAVALPMSDAQQAAVTGPVGLTPIQHWFFEQRLVKPAHFNQAIMLEVGEPLQASLLHEAVAHLVLHHDALRSRFTRDGEIWRQSCAAPTDAIPFHCVDLSHVAADESAAAIEAIAVAEQNDLDLAHGPLMRVCLIDLGSERPSRLLFVIHHLVVDGVSWRILLEDLHLVYQQLSRGESPCLGAKTTSYQEWSRRLVEYANSPALRHESDYWLSLAHVPTRHIPVDFNRATDQVHRDGGTVDQSDVVTVSLTSDETRRLLEEVPRAYRAQMNGVLLAALAQAFHAWMGDASLLVDLEGHGREDLFDDVDLSRTVGWFTSVFPVHLHLENAGDPQETIAAIETMLQKVPWRGVGFGMLKYLGDDASVSAALARLPSPEVSFNYLGQTDQLRSAGGRLRMASESTGAVRDGQQLRKHLLEINALVVEGQLRIDWTFSHAWHQRQTIENVAQAFIDAIQGTIAGCHDTASTISDRLAAYVAPRNALEAELTQWCERQLGQSPIGSEDDLSLLAHNPLTARECLASFALHHKLAVPPSDAEGASTVADLASIVRRAANRARRSPLTTIRGRGTKAPLFCVHPAGGSVFPYYALAHHLGADQPVYALEARGLAGHESCHETVQAMARDYIHALREVQPTGPFYLAGWSFGGLVAYEMARQLKLAQEQVPLVVLIDTQVAHDDSTDTGDDAFAALLAMFPTVEQVSPEEMRQLSRSDKIAIFARQVEGAGLIQRGADRWEVERQFEVFESTCRAWLDFRPAPYTGNVSLFLAQERPRDQQQEVASLWQLCIDGALRVRNMPGDHLTMMREPNVRELARHLTRHLAWANRKLEAAEAGSSISPLRAETSRDIDPDLSMLS